MHSIVFALFLLAASYAVADASLDKNNNADVFLMCKGDVYISRTDRLPEKQDKQEIAVHIKNGKINFSGNSLLLGENIPICTPLVDQPYFDSDTCGREPKRLKRNYGTYNKVTGTLSFTNANVDKTVWEIRGDFKCTKTEPQMK